MTLHEFVQLLESRNLRPRQLPNGQWLSLCPAHNDQEPSLSIAEGEKGIIVHCFAGCGVDAVCRALGISVADLFFADGDPLTALATAKRLPVEFLRKLGWKIVGDAVAIPFKNQQGETFYQYRHGLERRYSWQKGAKASEVVYGLAQLSDDTQEVWVCESAVDAATLQYLGISAIAVAGKGNAQALSHFADRLASIPTIIVWREPDATTFAEDIATALQRFVLCIQPANGQPKDANRLWLACNADPDKFLAELERLKANAVEIAPRSQAQQVAEPAAQAQKATDQQSCPFCELNDDELLAVAQPLLESDQPLKEATQRIVKTFGIVGEDANIQLLLLALTSRVFPQPISVLVTGGTGQGKSFLTDAVCATLPPCCHRRLVGASARALLFHPIAKGTVLQWLEMPEIGSDTIAATILRSILWQSPHEAETDYLFVEWTHKGARRRAVRMPRQIALVTTKVELPKDEQLLSRFLILEVRESTDKRMAVFAALAQSWNGDAPAPMEEILQPIRAFHHWLGSKKVKVTIPYASALAQLFAELPPSERDFRDFSTLLKLIAACALWHLQRRHHRFTEEGLEVTADISDYATVRQLLTPVWGKPRSAGLSEAERKVAEALRELAADHPPTAQDIARRLGIADGAVRTHLENLSRKGLVERGEKQGRAWTWRLVGDLDAFAVALPSVEAVLKRWRPDPDPTQPTAPTPEPDSPTDQPDPRSAKALTSANEPLALKTPVNTGTFVQALKRERNQYTSATTQPHNPCVNTSGNSADEATEEGIKNRYRFSGSPKTPVNTGEFSANEVLALRSGLALPDAPDQPAQPENSPIALPNCDNPVHSDGSDASDTDTLPWLCPRCGFTERRPIGTDLFADPVCRQCGAKMRLAPEDDGGAGAPLPDSPTEPPDSNPPSPSPPEKAQATSTGEAQGEFVDTEAWIAGLWREVGQSPPDAPLPEGEPVPQELIDLWLSDPRSLTFEVWLAEWQAKRSRSESLPIVTDLETGESIPVGDFLVSALRLCRCPRCGHEDAASRDLLMPPLCPACRAPMEWSGGGRA